eukprot:gene7643-8484_t
MQYSNRLRPDGNEDIIDSLPIREFFSHKGLLLGKVSRKVTIAFGMIIAVNAMDKVTFVNTVQEIIRQDPKPKGARSLVIVLLLSESRMSKIQKIFQVLRNDLSTYLSEGYIHMIISPFDSKPEQFERLFKRSRVHDVPKSTIKVNLQLSYLCHYSHKMAQYFTMIDSGVRPRPDALKTIYDEVNKMTPSTLEATFNDGPGGHLYNARFLPRLSSFLYSMAFVGALNRMLFIFQHASVNETKIIHNSKVLYDNQQVQFNNPPANVVTTMKSIYNDNQAYAYLGTGPSWFYQPQKGDTFTIMLNNLTKLKRIAIDTGLDSFLRDSLVDAVFELSYDKMQCVNYTMAKTFENSASIEVSSEKKEDEPLLAQIVHCMRIRVIKDHTLWSAIRMIIVEPE